MIIERRFRGPPSSANGGYACGVVAAPIGGPAEVTLRSPPPLEREIALVPADGGIVARAGDVVIATAVVGAPEVEAPAPVDFAAAERASAGYPWKSNHPFPMCFTCGPDRVADGGLCIFPGAVEGRDVAAAPWIPDASLAGAAGRVRPEIVWAALDCPSWFGMTCFQPWEGGALLGRLAARIVEAPSVGDRVVCVGWFIGREGRKIHCGSALYDDSGELRAVARATWIALDPTAFEAHARATR